MRVRTWKFINRVPNHVFKCVLKAIDFVEELQLSRECGPLRAVFQPSSCTE